MTLLNRPQNGRNGRLIQPDRKNGIQSKVNNSVCRNAVSMFKFLLNAAQLFLFVAAAAATAAAAVARNSITQLTTPQFILYLRTVRRLYFQILYLFVSYVYLPPGHGTSCEFRYPPICCQLLLSICQIHQIKMPFFFPPEIDFQISTFFVCLFRFLLLLRHYFKCFGIICGACIRM